MEIKLTGGTLMQARLDSIAHQLRGATSVRVGFLENASYPDGTKVALVAALNDFGTGTQPPRPFFRNMVNAKSPDWPRTMANLIRQHGYDAKMVLGLMGQGIVGQLRQSIVDTNSPPLAPSTIAAKGHAKPLVESGHMLNSADYEVT